MHSLDIDPNLMNPLIEATIEGFSMAEIVPVPVGVSKFPSANNELTVSLSFVGKNSGTATMSVAKRTAQFMAEAFLGEKITDESVMFDALGELGNIVVGTFKNKVAETDYRFEGLSCPSLIMGQSYGVYMFQGFKAVQVQFEIPELPASLMHERIFTMSLNMMTVN